MLNENWIIFGSFLSIIGFSTYIISIFKGKTKPNKVSWGIWAIASLIAFIAELKQGVGMQSLMTFSIALGTLLVFISSFFCKKFFWKVNYLDIACGSMAVIGIIIWKITAIANLAILFSILTDSMAAVPTIFKSYKFPETENGIVFLLSAVNALITLLTISNWNFENYAFPAYILIVCSLLFVLIQFKIGKLLKNSS